MSGVSPSQPSTETPHTPTPWMWAWRDDENAPASIFSMVREGHAYAVAMCPRYQKPEQWVADAKFITDAVNENATLKARIAELEVSEKARLDAYESILGPRTYNEVAEHIRGLEEAIRDAFYAGFMAYFGPVDLKGFDQAIRDEDEAWSEYSAALSHAGPVARDGEQK